jgi:thiosulfate/3-mercaptopyruvate sulfurtransferase
MRWFNLVGWAAAVTLVVALATAGPAVAAEKYKGFERGEALISVEELHKLMEAKDPKLVLIAVIKPVSFKLGYIPGSLNVWRPDYEPAKDEPYPFGGMMLNRAEFEKFARTLGVDDDSKVVLYDEKYDATRLWWAFYMYGKTDARVLDGGYQAWKAAGHDVDMAVFSPSSESTGDFVAKPRREALMASMDDVWRAKTDAEIQLWDTREKKEWTGEQLKKGAFRQGRIPWAKFLNWKEFKQPVAEGEQPTLFKDASGIKEVVSKHAMDPAKRHIFYCQSGVRTTTEMFALYLLGWDIDHLANYDGSWIEWSYHEKNPLVADAN